MPLFIPLGLEWKVKYYRLCSCWFVLWFMNSVKIQTTYMCFCLRNTGLCSCLGLPASFFKSLIYPPTSPPKSFFFLFLVKNVMNTAIYGQLPTGFWTEVEKHQAHAIRSNHEAVNCLSCTPPSLHWSLSFLLSAFFLFHFPSLPSSLLSFQPGRLEPFFFISLNLEFGEYMTLYMNVLALSLSLWNWWTEWFL